MTTTNTTAPSAVGRTEHGLKRRRRAAAFGLAGVLLIVGVTGSVLASGAYFTDQKTTPSNTITAGTIKLGGLGDTATAPVAAGTNVLPIAAGTQATKASVMNINVRNVGTAPFDWNAVISTPVLDTVSGITAPADTLSKINVQVSADGGTTWAAVTTLALLTSQSITSTTALAAPVGSADSTAPIKFRMWFDQTVGNAYQGVQASFSVTVKAIQAGIPMNDPNAIFGS